MLENPLRFMRDRFVWGLAGASVLFITTLAGAGEIDPSQKSWHERYRKQANAPQPADMKLNTDPEPAWDGEGFIDLFNGQDLTGWTALGGTCTFEAIDGEIVGTTVPGSPSTYLCTDDASWSDFIFTCDTFWEVDGNTGVMFRARSRPRKNAETPDEVSTAPEDQEVYGPQVEMEGFDGWTKGRNWSGAVYGQSCGGYWYPLWLKEHAAARAALKPGVWNRMTVRAKGNVVQTWINGVPAAYWEDEGSYPSGFFGLQVHSGGRGTIRWRNLRVKSLDTEP
ncbi:MAG: DUF1080 domain-containing protein [Planctomycetota bacterium]